MATRSPTHLFHRLDHGNYFMKRQETFRQFITSIFTRFHARSSKSEKEGVDESRRRQEASPTSKEAKQNERKNESSCISVYSSDDDDFSDKKWRLEFAWLTKALDPALQMCRRALVTVGDDNQKIPPSNRSLLEIVASLQRSKTNIQDWSLSDFTAGLYLVYLRQASEERNEDIDGVEISSEHIVEELIYHSELAKGSYKGNAAALARNSMLQEMNVLKYIKDSSILRPGYYIGTDIRNKSIILGIRGTHTVYDIITDMATSSDQEITFDGFSSHFGTAEAARWFLHHELGTIKKCLEQHPSFRLRLVGHSLGGAAAALLAIMLRRRSEKELGFSPDIVSAVGFGTPPCVSKELAETCASYVCTVVLQDDIVPRLSAASLARLRNEILQTDWISVLDKEDWKRFLELVTNAKQVVSSVQDVARKLADYANFKNKKNATELSEEVSAVTKDASKPQTDSTIIKRDAAMLEELFVPGAQYYLQRQVDASGGSSNKKGREYYKLWKRHRGKHFQRIVLSSNLISDHKCDNHYYALRDVLKSIPRSDQQKSISLYD